MPRWLYRSDVEQIHAEQLQEHGGTPGIRDEGLLESAIARPRQLFDFGQTDDILRLAACLAYGLAKNHAFLDGNKRTSLVATELFLAINFRGMGLSDPERYYTWYGLAAGLVSEDQLYNILASNGVVHADEVRELVRDELKRQGADDPYGESGVSMFAETSKT